MINGFSLDLITLVPGKDEKETIEGLLSKRSGSLGIRELNHKTLVHPRRDPGCYNEAHNILQPFINIASYALVVFDYEGSGQESRSAHDIADDLRDRLSRSGWQNRIQVLIIEPELEILIWSNSPQVDAALGWSGRSPNLRSWLSDRGIWLAKHPKPIRPKETLLKVLREVHVRRSSAVYRQLAENVSIERCQDPAFNKLKTILRSWFPAEQSQAPMP